MIELFANLSKQIISNEKKTIQMIHDYIWINENKKKPNDSLSFSFNCQMK